MKPNGLYPSYLLEPLHELPFDAPFQGLLTTPGHMLHASSLGLYDDTFTNEQDFLSTPSPVNPHFISGYLHHREEGRPPAPLLKDLDSFSEGTAIGSFNFSDTSEQDAGLRSLAFSPSHPRRSIEIWRNDVFLCLAFGKANALSSIDDCPPVVNSQGPATKRRRVSILELIDRPSFKTPPLQAVVPSAPLDIDRQNVDIYRYSLGQDIPRSSSAPPM